MCSTIIFGQNGQKYLAENYDYPLDHGLIAANLRGVQKSNGQQEENQLLSWTAKYGSVTFNQFSLELPVSGMNEAGLAISLMWHDEGDFGAGGNYRRLNELQWIQYQLDCFASIGEVVDALQTVRPEQGPVPLHFSLLDANGESLIVEFLNGELVLHKNIANPILTNSTYKTCLSFAKEYQSQSLQSAGNSMGRFVHLYRQFLKLGDVASVANGFAFLNSVNQSSVGDEAFPWSGDDSKTITAWSVVFDPIQRKITLKSSQNQKLREVDLRKVNLEADSVHQLLDVHAGESGAIESLFEPYTKERNLDILRQSAPLVGLPEVVVDELAQVVDSMYTREQIAT